MDFKIVGNEIHIICEDFEFDFEILDVNNKELKILESCVFVYDGPVYKNSEVTIDFYGLHINSKILSKLCESKAYFYITFFNCKIDENSVIPKCERIQLQDCIVDLPKLNVFELDFNIGTLILSQWEKLKNITKLGVTSTTYSIPSFINKNEYNGIYNKMK